MRAPPAARQAGRFSACAVRLPAQFSVRMALRLRGTLPVPYLACTLFCLRRTSPAPYLARIMFCPYRALARPGLRLRGAPPTRTQSVPRLARSMLYRLHHECALRRLLHDTRQPGRPFAWAVKGGAEARAAAGAAASRCYANALQTVSAQTQATGEKEASGEPRRGGSAAVR